MNKGMLIMILSIMGGTTLTVSGEGTLSFVNHRVKYDTSIRLVGGMMLSAKYLDREHIEEIEQAMDWTDEMVIGTGGQIALSKKGVILVPRWSFADDIDAFDYEVALDFTSPYPVENAV